MLQLCDDLLNDLFAATMARLLQKICRVRNMDMSKSLILNEMIYNIIKYNIYV